ncbi:hypothetical protein F5884DRAFT_761274 [Xylogone sp. PMI_703]|nr:hypothetical protein F5884DRAFT_761274 [Xylogone sp. PMI_703]
MSKSVAYKHYDRILAKWPKDLLRPEVQFQNAMRRRLDRQLQSGINEKTELENVNTLYSLLGNRYRQIYPIRGSLLKPASNPTHYTDLLKELEEAPNRSWFGRMTNKWRGFLRFQ